MTPRPEPGSAEWEARRIAVRDAMMERYRGGRMGCAPCLDDFMEASMDLIAEAALRAALRALTEGEPK